MDAAVARNIAHYSHTGQRDRFGEPLIEHVERVAAGVPREARAVAFLHDVLERSSTGVDELRAQGLTPAELAALELLTRSPGERYELYALRIAWAPGREGHVARVVKLADLEDHLSHPIPADAPAYEWARRHILVADGRLGAPEAAA